MQKTRAIDLTGQRFGMLTVIKRASPRPYYKGAVWLCQCDCGNTIETLGASLRKGDSKSCGCYRRKCASERKRAIHGLSHDRLYIIWRNMHDRCENPNAISYRLYGEKGISVCKEWGDLFAFIEWANAHGYSADLTLDRIDGTKGYSPDNCRWVTKLEQQNNKSNNHLLTVNGESKTIAEWARISGLTHSLISSRIRMGWDAERAVTTPKGAYRCRKSD